MRVSIVIPCYNGFQYMERCLRALENQTFKDFEVIVVDDCSSDDSYEKICSYKKTSALDLKVLKNDVNCGPGESRNNGISAAQGEWLAFCDCDDWYENEFLEKMLDKAEASEVELVMCDNYYVSGEGTRTKRSSVQFFDDNSGKEEFIALSKMALWRLLVKRKLFEGLRLPQIYNGEDGAVVPGLIAKAKHIGVLQEALYNYLLRENSGSTKPSPKVYSGLIQSFIYAENSLEGKYPLQREFIGIKTVAYGATFNAYAAGIKTKTIKEFMRDFEGRYPGWRFNPYIKRMPFSKRFYLSSLKHHCYAVLKLYAKLHNVYVYMISQKK